MKKVSLVLLMLLFTLTSCAKPLEYTDNKKAEKNLDVANVDFEYVDISDIEGDKTYQYITYPVTKVSDERLKSAIEDMNKSYKEVAERFKEENKEEVRSYMENFMSEDDDRYYMHEVYPNILTDDDKYLSLLMRTEEDLLGAHGSYILEGWNFDKKTGKKLSIYDMVKSKEELKNFILDWCKNNEDNDEIGFYEDYKDTIEKYFNDDYKLEFTIDNGIVAVVFQAYDIAPYAAGPIEIQLDNKILK